MCTNHLRVVGETKKFYCTLSGKKKNWSASINEKEVSIYNLFKHDKSLFAKVITAEALKEVWFSQKSKQKMMMKKTKKETLNDLFDTWLQTASKKLIQGRYKYSKRKKNF